MRRCLKLIDRVAPTDLAVFLRGESGTGKEVLARALHDNGPRQKAAFVVLNCAAFSPGLVEAELFGHSAGAYTGAGPARPGLLELADRGTLFLDEIGDMAWEQQKSLLRVLESGSSAGSGKIKHGKSIYG